MARPLNGRSYGHGMKWLAPDKYKIWWRIEGPSVRGGRHHTTHERITDGKKARTFARKWNLDIVTDSKNEPCILPPEQL